MATFSRHAVLEWSGNVTHGEGRVTAGSSSFSVSASFPRVNGELPGMTTPEEMLAASHAICYGLGLRSIIGKRGGTTRGITVTATITAEKGPDGIVIQSSHLDAILEGLMGVDRAAVEEIADATERECTISNALCTNVSITHAITVA
jgi:osmotically inducible protein OsmC